MSGIIRSKELISLARPLAALLVMLFVFSAFINASLAAGSTNIICQTIIALDGKDGGNSPRSAMVDHCSLCTMSADDHQPDLPPQALIFDDHTSRITCLDLNKHHEKKQSFVQFNIRAPPIS